MAKDDLKNLRSKIDKTKATKYKPTLNALIFKKSIIIVTKAIERTPRKKFLLLFFSKFGNCSTENNVIKIKTNGVIKLEK